MISKSPEADIANNLNGKTKTRTTKTDHVKKMTGLAVWEEKKHTHQKQPEQEQRVQRLHHLLFHLTNCRRTLCNLVSVLDGVWGGVGGRCRRVWGVGVAPRSAGKIGQTLYTPRRGTENAEIQVHPFLPEIWRYCRVLCFQPLVSRPGHSFSCFSCCQEFRLYFLLSFFFISAFSIHSYSFPLNLF